jgi:fibronectin-binding autotransporter adhesin
MAPLSIGSASNLDAGQSRHQLNPIKHMNNLRLSQSLRLPLPLTLLTLILAATTSGFGATLTVTNLADAGPGTLRDRIATANPGDIINFGVFGNITLASQLTLAKNLRIEGPGPGFLKVSGNNNSRVFNITTGAAQIYSMLISDGRVVGTNGAVGANGQTVMGGGIFIANGASLASSGVILSNNAAIGGQGGSQNQFGDSGNGGNGLGGGIANLGTLTFISSTLVNNSATGGPGGPITDGANPGAGGQGWGGALYNEGSVNFTIVSVTGNAAGAGTGLGGPGTGAGGGIFNYGTVGLIVSTVANNSATGSSFDSGGGIQNYGTLNIVDATIAGNQADYSGGLGGGGTMGNSILALNTATASGPDGSGTITSTDYNLIQNTAGLTISGVTTHNITGQNPLLGPLQDNGVADYAFGFSMLTLKPLPGSPVIDKGQSGNSDQLNQSRPYDGTIANAAGGNGADIGAVEIFPGPLVVLNTNNTGVGSLRQALADNSGLGGGNTITFSNSVAGTITLSGAHLTLAAPAFIRGPGPEVLAISANQIGRVFQVNEGPSEISGLTIRDGLITGSPGQGGQPNGGNGVGGGIYNQTTLLLSNCVVLSNSVVGGIGAARQNGVVGNGGLGLGGGLYNASGVLNIVRTTFAGNRATGGRGGPAQQSAAGQGGNGVGGAIHSAGGSNQMVQCTFAANRAEGGWGGSSGGDGSPAPGGQGHGGAIYAESPIALIRSTIHSGRAAGGNAGDGTTNGAGSGYGGGIYLVANLELQSSTIASNSATGSSFDFGGGVYSVGSAGITNTTIAANTADFGGGWHGDAAVANSIFALNTAGAGADFNGTMNSFDYNLVQSFAGLNIIGATANVLIGINPLLGSLQNNGGPTPTLALLPGSPALDQGKSFGSAFDQRGSTRPYNLPSITNAGGGDGSDIGAYELLPAPQLNIQRGSADTVVLSWSSDAADYHLECVTNLPPTGNWLEVTNQRVFLGDQTYVTNAATGSGKFYRLRFP